jgi:hypothetical protein
VNARFVDFDRQVHSAMTITTNATQSAGRRSSLNAR